MLLLYYFDVVVLKVRKRSRLSLSRCLSAGQCSARRPAGNRHAHGNLQQEVHAPEFPCTTTKASPAYGGREGCTVPTLAGSLLLIASELCVLSKELQVEIGDRFYIYVYKEMRGNVS